MPTLTLADAFSMIVPPDRGIGFRAYDGSSAGPADAAVTIELRNRRAVEHIAAAPSSLGVARAYVMGDLEIVGDPYVALCDLFPFPTDHLTWGAKAALARALAPYALARPTPPPQERRLGGVRHSKDRDAEAIQHHYDVSNTFYSYVLGPSMAYTCAVFPSADASLEVAQEDKVDLVCRKLGLRPGMRLLDVGCGWGGMVRHAAKHYGVKALGVTLSEQQATWAQQAIEREGLGHLAEVRHSDYRDVPEGDFDAVSSIGLTEHIGRAQYPSYFAFLYAKLRPEGRMLNHTITRPNDSWVTHVENGFIHRYVFPDGELSGPVQIMGAMNGAGFEIRHEENLREHYALTLKHWSANLERNWDACVAEAGEATTRVWRLYMAGSRVAFEVDHIELHQTLGVKLGARGRSGMPLRPDVDRRVASFVPG